MIHARGVPVCKRRILGVAAQGKRQNSLLQVTVKLTNVSVVPVPVCKRRILGVAAQGKWQNSLLQVTADICKGSTGM